MTARFQDVRKYGLEVGNAQAQGRCTPVICGWRIARWLSQAPLQGRNVDSVHF